MTFLEIIKWIFLVVAITFTFTNVVRPIKGQSVPGLNIWIMAASIVGFLVFQFGLGV